MTRLIKLLTFYYLFLISRFYKLGFSSHEKIHRSDRQYCAEGDKQIIKRHFILENFGDSLMDTEPDRKTYNEVF